MNFLRQALAAVRLLLVMTVLLGVAYPLVITGIAQLVAPAQANGSTLTNGDGQVVGSALIGQLFEGPQWFQGRASASDYSGETSGGSNLSPVSADQSEAQPVARLAIVVQHLLQHRLCLGELALGDQVALHGKERSGRDHGQR